MGLNSHGADYYRHRPIADAENTGFARDCFNDNDSM